MAKGKKTGGGSRAGKPNKLTGQVKEMILEALDQAGGVAYLAEQATENPAAFLSLVGKVLPLQVTGDKENPVAVSIDETSIAQRIAALLTVGNV